MKSIVYKPFLSQNDTSVPEIKITGYKPRYNWKDNGKDNGKDDPQSESTTESSEPTPSQPTWANPEGTKIISDLNDPIYKTNSSDPTPVSTTTTVSPTPTKAAATTTRTATVGSTGLTIGKTVSTPDGIMVKTPFGYKPTISPQASVKHVFKTSDIDVKNMQGVLDAFADAGIPLRITSGYRPGAKTSSGKDSWHGSGWALDVTPIDGWTYEDLKQAIKESPELINYLRDNQIGILDETSEETRKKTKGTGAHWHIGPDRSAIMGLETILKGKQGLKIPILFNNGNDKKEMKSER